MGPGQSGGKGVDMIQKQRRGQMYSIIAILMAIPIMFFMTYYISSVQTMKFGTTERMVADQLRETERGIENDFERAIEITGIRACLGATDYMIREGQTLDNASYRLEELIVNGTIYGNQTYVMVNNSIYDWRTRILSITPGFNIIINFFNYSIENNDGFSLLAQVRLYFNISDRLNTVKISKDVVKNISIPIENIEDPTFPYNTLGSASRGIIFHPYPYHAVNIVTGTASLSNCSGNVSYNPSDPSPGGKILVTADATGISGFEGVVGEGPGIPSVSCYIVGATGAVSLTETVLNQSNYTELNIDMQTDGLWSLPINDALEKGYYTHFENESGPNLLMRLEGNLSETSNGIETFVNVPGLQDWGVPIKPNQVSLAYLYFDSSTHTGFQVRGLPDWFRIDAARAVRYNLTDLM